MAKFQQCVLHFGGPKTGSSSIQELFEEARGRLIASRELAYAPGHWHPELGSAFSEDPVTNVYNANFSDLDLQSIRGRDSKYLEELIQWLEQVPACRILMFSYEGFPTLSVQEMTRLRDFLSQFADRVIAVYFARPPLAYAISEMSQRAVSGIDPFNPVDPPIAPHADYLSRIHSAFGKHGASVSMMPSPPLDVIDLLCGILGIPRSLLLGEGTKHNASISWEGMVVAEGARRALVDEGISLSVAEFHSQLGFYIQQIPGRPIKLSREQVKVVAEVSRVHSAALAELDVTWDEEDPPPLDDGDLRQSAEAERLNDAGRILALAYLGWKATQAQESDVATSAQVISSR